MQHRTSGELKRIAREKLTGHWGLAIGSELLVSLIVSALLMPFYFLVLISGEGTVQNITYFAASLIIGVLSVIMQAGVNRIYLCFARKQDAGIGMIFEEFKRRPDRYVLGTVMLIGIDIICMLPGCLCMGIGLAEGTALAGLIGAVLSIAGTIVLFIITLRYSLIFILLVEHSEMSAMEAFGESARIMEGNKGRMFYIYLSFIGWSVLGMLSCGLGMLWVTPYMNQTTITFYQDVTGELDRHMDLNENQFGEIQ